MDFPNTSPPLPLSIRCAAGVALVRCCFPFGSPGTSVFGHPSLRYFEVSILPPRGAETPRTAGTARAGSQADGSGSSNGAELHVDQEAIIPGSSIGVEEEGQPLHGQAAAGAPPGAVEQEEARRTCGVSLGVVESQQALRMLSNGLHLGWYR